MYTLVVKVRLKGAAESPLQPVERETAEIAQELLKDSTRLMKKDRKLCYSSLLSSLVFHEASGKVC